MTFNERAGSVAEITSIVHDLRNPLSTIHGSAEILIGSGLSEPHVHRLVLNIFRASVRMEELLDEFLSRHRGTHNGVECSKLCDLVASAVDKVALLAESQSVEIVQSVPMNLVIPLDQQRIRRVLVNLFVNALDVMPNGGTIRISAVRMRDFVLVKVRDTGPGIASEIRKRLFEPFATAGKAGGLGLGLALSRLAVLDHGGWLWAESAKSGACFAFRLPNAASRQSTPNANSYARIRRTGGAASNDSLRGSPGSKVSAILKISSLARLRCSPALA
jgi:signal transduction histidine kinase